MNNKIEAFNTYLATVRKNAEEGFKEKTKKFTYKYLVKYNVIAETEIDTIILKKMVFIITQTSMDQFQIKGKIKSGPSSLAEYIKLDLEQLLTAKENAEQTFDIGALVLNVRPTLGILNSNFY